MQSEWDQNEDWIETGGDEKNRWMAGGRVGGGMTFILSIYRAGILPSRFLNEGIDSHAQLSQINSSPNIVRTKHWLFNEIPVAVFHLTSLVKVPIMFHFTPISTSGTSESRGQLHIWKLTFCWQQKGVRYSNLWRQGPLAFLYATMLNTKLLQGPRVNMCKQSNALSYVSRYVCICRMNILGENSTDLPCKLDCSYFLPLKLWFIHHTVMSTALGYINMFESCVTCAALESVHGLTKWHSPNNGSLMWWKAPLLLLLHSDRHVS